MINYVYFWYSLLYLFARTLLAQYFAATIHGASNYPLEVLKAVPLEGWCVEVQRFIDQIRSQTMAFSGYKFFYLTRNTILTVNVGNIKNLRTLIVLLLQMLTTLVTYELVLLQFDKNEDVEIETNYTESVCLR